MNKAKISGEDAYYFSLEEKESKKEWLKEMAEQRLLARKKLKETDVSEIIKTIENQLEHNEEMQAQSTHLVELESKFDKLKEQMDEIRMMLSQLTSQNKEYSLSEAEKNVFMVLYSVEQTPLSYSDIVMRTGLTELAVKAHIFSMINKGIPIIERKISNQSYFRLDRKFKELQANENILKIDIEQF